jgi:hypothetical protein
MDKKSKLIEKLIDILNLKGFVKNNYDDCENTKSIISFVCDKGHNCSTRAKNLLYSNVGCKKCQYDRVRNVIDVDLDEKNLKKCNLCKKDKNKSCFGLLKSNYDGLRNDCKLCRRKKTITEDFLIKKERSLKSLKYLKDKPFRVLISRCKSNNNKKGMISFDITEEFLKDLYYKQNGKCYWSGIDLPIDNLGLGELNSISIDRLDCNLGYIQSNVVISSKFYNIGRGNMNVDDFKKFLIYNKLIISENLK